MARSPILALALIGSLLAPAFGDSRDALICFPGAPDAGEAGDRVAARLADHLFAGADPKRVARYFNKREAGKAFVDKQKAGWALIGFEVYLEWRRSKRPMTVLAAAEVGGSVDKRFLVVLPKDSKKAGLTDLANQELCSNLVRDERFVRRLVFGSKGETIKLRWIDRALRGLKRCARGQLEGLIIDEEQWRGIQELKRYGSKLKLVHRSPPMPKALVVAFEGCKKEDQAQIRDALLKLDKVPAGAKLLETLRVTAFRPAPKAEALNKLYKIYAGDKP